MSDNQIPIGEDEIIKSLEEAIKLNLVEVVGITSDGSWLYGATNECRKLLADNTSLGAIADALENMKEAKEQ